MTIFKYIIVLILFLFLGKEMYAQKPMRIEILNANSIEFDEKIGKDVKRLLGDVQFKHGNALMYCDSAYLNSKTNLLRAFSNVHIIQNDSIDLYGDFLNYNGNSRIAKVRQNVRLIHGNSTLTTDSLDYDRTTNIAHYFSWGYLKDQDNDLQSIQGYYYSNTNDYYAVDSVVLTNPKYKIYSDSLRYNTGTDISYFYGPTDIISDSNLIYCEYGWYDTKNDLARVSKNSYIQNKEKKLKGDSIFYDKAKGFGEAFSHVSVLDSTAKVLITGEYANYYEKRDSAFVTDKALMTKYGGGDTLFLHADTLKIYTLTDTLWLEPVTMLDSLLDDSLETNLSQEMVLEDTVDSFTIDTAKIITAYYHVQAFKIDLQMRCDSLVYSTKDSVIQMYNSPVIWSDDQQVTADYIKILTEDNSPTEMYLDKNAFIILKEDSLHFNQIEGVNMQAYFEDNTLSRLRIENQAKSIFFPREEPTAEQERDSLKGDLIGANFTESRRMTIWFDDNQPSKITLYSNPKGVLEPLEYKPVEQQRLEGFVWKDAIRPKTLSDIFVWKEEIIIDNKKEVTDE